MKLTVFEQCRRRRNECLFAMLIFALSFFYAAVVTPVSIWVSSDIVISESIAPLFSDFFGTVLNYVFYWTAFAFLLHMMSRYTVRNIARFLLIFFGAVLFRYFASLNAGYLMNGFPVPSDFLSDDLPYVLLDIGLDSLQMGFVLLFAHLLMSAKQQDYIRKKKFYGSADGEPLLPQWLPLCTLNDFSNPVQCCSLIGAILPAAVQTVSRIIYDVSTYGTPQGTADLIWMIVSYLSDVIYAVIGYFVILLILNRLCRNEEKVKKDYDAS